MATAETRSCCHHDLFQLAILGSMILLLLRSAGWYVLIELIIKYLEHPTQFNSSRGLVWRSATVGPRSYWTNSLQFKNFFSYEASPPLLVVADKLPHLNRVEE